MGFAIPWVFGVAIAAALAITALHFLSVRQPRVLLLPTARFVPERDARAVARQAKPSDLPLLLLRVIALLSAGAALAGARCGASGTTVSSIVVIDATLRADSAALVARAVTVSAAGDVKTRVPTDVSPPTVLWVNGVLNDPGVAITAAIRESARQAQSNPSLTSLSLAVVMPTSVRSRDGWDAWREQWPASIYVLPLGSASGTDTNVVVPQRPLMVRVVGVAAARGMTNGSDVVEVAFASRGALAVRDAVLDSSDVEVQRVGTGAAVRDGIVVQWPLNGVPTGWTVAPATDSVGAVTAAGIALVAPWVRTALPPTLSDSVRAIAWWSDGVAAAVERTRGTSCVREVALAVPTGGDLLLSPAADGVLRALRAPCGGRGVPAPREGASVSQPQRGGVAPNASAYASAGRFRDAATTSRTTRPAWLATALLLVAVLSLLAEYVVRRESTRTVSGASAS